MNPPKRLKQIYKFNEINEIKAFIRKINMKFIIFFIFILGGKNSIIDSFSIVADI